MIRKIKITLTDGQKYELRQPETLSEIDRGRTSVFLFDNMQLYEGCSDGEVDEDGDFCIKKPGLYHAIGMPFSRLVGWAYEHKGKQS